MTAQPPVYRSPGGRVAAALQGSFHQPPWLACAIVIRMATKKPTKAEKLVQEQMLALLEWASDRPKSWHPIGTLPETQRAAELLASRGVIEIRRAENQNRIKPKN
jgi:hypothetical protein